MVDLKEKRISEVTSFRLNTEMMNDLKSVAKKQKLPVNTLVSNILESHLGWDISAAEVGWVVMLKAGMIEMIKSLDEQAVSNIAKKVADVGAKEISLYMRGKYGIDEWISIFRERSKMSGFSLKEHKEKDRIKLVMHHDMGEKWSVFFKSYYETVFNDLGAKVSIDFTENTVMIELENISP